MRRLTGGLGLLEGARWYPDTGLVFSDMTGGGIYALAGSRGPVTLVPHRKGIGGLVAHVTGGVVVTGRNLAHKPFGEASSRTTSLLETAPDEQFFNDLGVDGRGRVFVGSVAIDPVDGGVRGPGRLYCVDAVGAVSVLADDVLISNGIGAAPADDLLYHVDSGRRAVWAYPLADPMQAQVRRPFVDTAEYDGVPDGLAVAEDGSVWVAMAGGGVVVGWNARGERIEELAVPQSLVTSVCFGGPDRHLLYVLTGHNVDHPDPAGGCVYVCERPQRGMASPVASVPLSIPSVPGEAR